MTDGSEKSKNRAKKIGAGIYVAGIDVGSAFTKAVVFSNGGVIAHHILPSGGDYKSIAEQVIKAALDKADLSIDKMSRITATGYGGGKVSFSTNVANDITCQGKGVGHLFKPARTVVDIGAQFTRVFRINDRGSVLKFIMSDKCAAGSGKFLQIIAKVLQVDLKDIGELSLQSKREIDFNAGCAVFAESEAVSRVAEGAATEDILAGLHRALAGKIESMIIRLGLEQGLSIIGGGAKDIGLVKSIEEKTGLNALIPDEPQIVAALGAALIAMEAINS